MNCGKASFRRAYAAAAAGAFVLLMAPSASGEEEEASLVRRGQALVTRDCSPCHAVGRTGASRHRQAPPLRTLGQRYPVEQLEEALGEGIVSGHADMPEFVFDPADVGAIIAYLKSIQEIQHK